MILEYFIPGYIFIVVFMYFTSHKISSPFLWQSIAISYILQALFSVVHNILFTDIIFSWGTQVLILTIISAILSVITIFISESKLIKKWLTKINHKTIHEDIWLDVVDYTGTTVRCICNDNVMYCGTLTLHEEKGVDSWFILEDYIIEENGKTYDSNGVSFSSKLAVNLRNVKRIELYYA